MRVRLGLLLGLASTLGYTAVASAVPVMPGTSPTHQYMFDTYDATGKVADEGTSSTTMDLYNRTQNVVTSPGYSHMVLVGTDAGTRPDYSGLVGYDQLGYLQANVGGWSQPTSYVTLTGQQAVPFTYSGNKSIVLDGKAGANTYAERTHAGGVSATVDATTDLAGAAGTISFWYKPIQHAGYGDGYLFTMRDTVSGERMYLLEPGTGSLPATNSNLTFRNVGGSDVVTSLPGFKMTPTGAVDGQPQINTTWYHVAVTWNNTNVKVYRNGNLLGTSASAFTGFQPNLFEIGAYSTYGSAAPGLYDEFAMWNTAMSEDEIDWLATNSLTTLSPVPEPASAAMMLAGLVGLGLFRRNKRH